MDPVLKIVLSIVGGGGIGAFLTYLLGSKKVDAAKDTADREQIISEFKTLLDERKEITDKLIEENNKVVEKLQKKINELEDEIKSFKKQLDIERNQVSTLRTQLLLFESSHVDTPLPMWIKDLGGRMIFLNKSYEDEFLIPLGKKVDDYIGLTDYDMWPKKVADDFVANDNKVISSKASVKSIESVKDFSGKIKHIEVLKYPRLLNGNVIGVSGIVIDSNPNSEKLKLYGK